MVHGVDTGPDLRQCLPQQDRTAGPAGQGSALKTAEREPAVRQGLTKGPSIRQGSDQRTTRSARALGSSTTVTPAQRRSESPNGRAWQRARSTVGFWSAAQQNIGTRKRGTRVDGRANDPVATLTQRAACLQKGCGICPVIPADERHRLIESRDTGL